MKSLNAAVLCGDLRQCYLAEYLNKLGHRVTCYGTAPFFHDKSIQTGLSFEAAVGFGQLVLCPVPFAKDGRRLAGQNETVFIDRLLKYMNSSQLLAGGNIPDETKNAALQKGIMVFDYMTCDTLANENAEITAEGMLQCVLEKTPFALSEANVLITGFGRCGLALGKKFMPLCRRLTVYDTDLKRLMLAAELRIQSVAPNGLTKLLPEQSIIINTVPGTVFSTEQLTRISDHCYLFDLASSPGCMDTAASRKLDFPFYTCPGLPGKTAPETAGEALGRSILSHLLD